MAASSSAAGKAAGEGYVPTGPAWGPCAPAHRKHRHLRGQPNGFSGRQQETRQQPTNKTPLTQIFSTKIMRR